MTTFEGGIRIGYTFNDESVNNTSINEEYLDTIQEHEKKIDQLEQEISKMKNSKSWLITSPIRKVRKKIGR